MDFFVEKTFSNMVVYVKTKKSIADSLKNNVSEGSKSVIFKISDFRNQRIASYSPILPQISAHDLHLDEPEPVEDESIPLHNAQNYS